MNIQQRAMKPNNTCRGILSGWKCGKAFTAVALFAAATPVVFARGVGTGAQGQAAMSPWSLGEAFTFLFLTLGPFNVLGPFVAMTHGRDTAFKRRLAFRAFIIATLALLVAATLGAKTLQKWGISVGALLLTAGVILFLVALQPVLAGYKQREPRVESTATATVPAPSLSELAFSPLAFPTIVAPYGIAVLILLVTLYPLSAGGLQILGVAAFVLALDLLAMLSADLIAKTTFITSGLDIVGSVMGILQLALGVQAVMDGLRLLRVVGAGR
jgi:multiple antibiotic resistance protein